MSKDQIQDNHPHPPVEEQAAKSGQELQKVQLFVTKAPERIQQQNQQSYVNFRTKLQQKSKTNLVLVPKEPIEDIKQFVFDAPTSISKQSSDKFGNFKQQLQRKSTQMQQYQAKVETVVKESQVEEEQAIDHVFKFVVDAPIQVSKQSSDKYENFKQQLLIKSNTINVQNKSVKKQPRQISQKQLRTQNSNEQSMKVKVFIDAAPNQISKKNTLQSQQFLKNLQTKAQLVQSKQIPPTQGRSKNPSEFYNENEFEEYKDQPEMQGQQMPNEITQIVSNKNQDQTISETSQLIQMMNQDKAESQQFRSKRESSSRSREKKSTPQKPTPSKLTPIKNIKYPQNQYRKQLNEQMDYSRYIQEKERLKIVLQEELAQISSEIREMRSHQPSFGRVQSKKTIVPYGNQVKEMIDISDDFVALNKAQDLIKRMNHQRQARRVKQKQEYAQLERYIRDDIDKLREQQEVLQFEQDIKFKSVAIQMEDKRKEKIQKRMDDYHKRQFEFAQLQQANQEFVRELLTNGPQEGQLAQKFEHKVTKIVGEPKRRIILKHGAIVYLPSIRNKKEQNIFQVQQQHNEQTEKAQGRRYLKPKLPIAKKNYSIQEQLMQVELEKAMIEKYKESRLQLLNQQQFNEVQLNEEEYDNEY